MQTDTTPRTLYTATFTFAKGEYDDDFLTLDAAIAEIAKSLPGYLGEEAWENPASGLISTVYYWDNQEDLQALMRHPLHRQAKTEQARWLKGFHVTIGQILGSYGDGGITHPLTGRDVRFAPVTGDATEA